MTTLMDEVQVTRRQPGNPGLEALLELDGEIFPMDNGYWTKFEVRRVEPRPQAPHGIKYSLTLHDQNNRRVLGYDNAHAIRPGRKPYAAHRTTRDHRHGEDGVEHYGFESAEKLMDDFWRDVDEILNQMDW